MTTTHIAPSPYDEFIYELEKKLADFRQLVKDDPKKAHQQGRAHLIRTGLIDSQGRYLAPYQPQE